MLQSSEQPNHRENDDVLPLQKYLSKGAFFQRWEPYLTQMHYERARLIDLARRIKKRKIPGVSLDTTHWKPENLNYATENLVLQLKHLVNNVRPSGDTLIERTLNFLNQAEKILSQFINRINSLNRNSLASLIHPIQEICSDIQNHREILLGNSEERILELLQKHQSLDGNNGSKGKERQKTTPIDAMTDTYHGTLIAELVDEDEQLPLDESNGVQKRLTRDQFFTILASNTETFINNACVLFEKTKCTHLLKFQEFKNDFAAFIKSRLEIVLRDLPDEIMFSVSFLHDFQHLMIGRTKEDLEKIGQQIINKCNLDIDLYYRLICLFFSFFLAELTTHVLRNTGLFEAKEADHFIEILYAETDRNAKEARALHMKKIGFVSVILLQEAFSKKFSEIQDLLLQPSSLRNIPFVQSFKGHIYYKTHLPSPGKQQFFDGLKAFVEKYISRTKAAEVNFEKFFRVLRLEILHSYIPQFQRKLKSKGIVQIILVDPEKNLNTQPLFFKSAATNSINNMLDAIIDTVIQRLSEK